jgi:uncharacterized protein
MSGSDDVPSSFQFEELDAEECLRLLRVTRIGRIVWLDGDEPQALPVNYVMDKDAILFRTSPDSGIAKVAQQRSAAFEVDEIDEFGGTGWSVLVTGTPGLVESADLPRSFYDRPQPWAPGARNLYIRLEPRRITGRRIVSHL